MKQTKIVRFVYDERVMKLMGDYSFVLDAAVLAACIVLIILSKATYTKKTSRYKYFLSSIISLMIATSANVFYHVCVNESFKNGVIVYIAKMAYYIPLITVLALFNLYVADLIELGSKAFERFILGSYSVFVLLTMIEPITTFGYNIDKDGNIYSPYYITVFAAAYVMYLIILTINLYGHKNIVVKRVVNSVAVVFTISIAIILIQAIFKGDSFTCFTFFLPTLAVFVLLHSNSYDVDFGTLDFNAFVSYFGEILQKKEEVVVVNIYVENFTTDMYIKKNKIAFQKFINDIKYNNFVFKITEDRMIFVYKKSEFDAERIMNCFNKLHEEYQLDQKTIFTTNIEMFKSAYDYQNFYEFIETRMKYNTYRMCNEQDIYAYINNQYIKQELNDIVERGDLNDKRILAYCQPVLDIAKNRYTSAEALMRLKLDKIGLVYPDVFIPMAEEFKYIHKLSLIILNKVCAYISENPKIERISVNFSIDELKDSKFCDDITSVISRYDIDYGKIAIEITESRTLDDFVIIKDRIIALKKLGFKFYLDDFGTGYSNFERILGLPIDIIKFDRSLVIFAKGNNESKYMISNFADIFKRLGYDILFEGIEDETDEEMCRKMKADYLQGYKYSKPIPIEELNRFL